MPFPATFSLSSIVFFLREFFVKKRGALAYIFAFLLITFFTIYIIRSALDTFHLSTDIDSLRLNSFWLFLIGVTFIPMLSVAMGWESITRNYKEVILALQTNLSINYLSVFIKDR